MASESEEFQGRLRPASRQRQTAECGRRADAAWAPHLVHLPFAITINAQQFSADLREWTYLTPPTLTTVFPQGGSSAGGTTRDSVDDGTGVFDTSRRSTALAGATPNDALVLADDNRHGVLESCKFALCFYAAAASLIAFDTFLRVSALRTMSPMLRESTFSGAMDGHSRRTAAAALDAYFHGPLIQTHLTGGSVNPRPSPGLIRLI